MLDLILHHYPASPFSEKVRLIFGYKQLRWKSVVIPMIMPKPDVVALTGGYRKTPFLQIGADIYCDSALIADVLEELHPSPTIYPAATGGEARLLAHWADSTLFWTMIPYAMQPAGLQSLMGNAPPEHLQAFAMDRKAFRGSAPRMPLGEAAGTLPLYLARLDSMLTDGRDFLLGAVPTIADFSVYHSLWFLRRATAVSAVLDPYARLQPWMARIAAIGHGQHDPMTSGAAVDLARTGVHAGTVNHALQDFQRSALGERVTVAAADYGIDPVEGELVIAAGNEIAVRRTDPRAGEVIVHFPRIGFQLSRLS